jgi:hypothetical protein
LDFLCLLDFGNGYIFAALKFTLMKFIYFFLFISFLYGCKKEESESGSDSSSSGCNCGVITADGINSSTDCHWLEIRNNCSGNKKTFCFDYDVWFDGNPGENFCVTNVTSW